MVETVIKCDGCRSHISGEFIRLGNVLRILPTHPELPPEMWSMSSVGAASQRTHQFCSFLCVAQWAMKRHEHATEAALIVEQSA
jgi:hypothetical protein